MLTKQRSFDSIERCDSLWFLIPCKILSDAPGISIHQKFRLSASSESSRLFIPASFFETSDSSLVLTLITAENLWFTGGVDSSGVLIISGELWPSRKSDFTRVVTKGKIFFFKSRLQLHLQQKYCRTLFSLYPPFFRRICYHKIRYKISYKIFTGSLEVSIAKIIHGCPT